MDTHKSLSIVATQGSRQGRRIVLNGFETKKRRRAEGGRELRQTAGGSRMKRHKSKLLSK